MFERPLARFALLMTLPFAFACKGSAVTDPNDITGYSVSLSSSTLTIGPGSTGTTTVNITRTTFADQVELSVNGAPSGVTATFNPSSHPGTTATLTLLVGSGVAIGNYQLTISGISTAGVESAKLTLTVTSVVTGGGIVSSVAAGAFHTCGIKTTGAAYCWGRNSFGQLGDGTTTDRVIPTLVSGVFKYSSLAAGAVHTCGIIVTGSAYCWGSNSGGGLGDGSTTDHLTPSSVLGNLIFAGLTVADTPGRTCGVTTAGLAYCWGNNPHGEVGDGSVAQHYLPNLVSGGRNYVSLSTGTENTCGVTTLGLAFCWGSNSHGEVGDGTIFTGTYNWANPTAVTGGLTFSALSAGATHTCGITIAGALYCWGENTLGQLGDGTATNHFLPTLVSGGLSFAKISAGDAHTCAIATSGAAYCWGDNTVGELGDGTGIQKLVPTLVSDTLRFTVITTGAGHTCGLTLLSTVVCWGLNSNGQIGDGTTANRFAPTVVIF